MANYMPGLLSIISIYKKHLDHGNIFIFELKKKENLCMYSYIDLMYNEIPPLVLLVTYIYNTVATRDVVI